MRKLVKFFDELEDMVRKVYRPFRLKYVDKVHVVELRVEPQELDSDMLMAIAVFSILEDFIADNKLPPLFDIKEEFQWLCKHNECSIFNHRSFIREMKKNNADRNRLLELNAWWLENKEKVTHMMDDEAINAKLHEIINLRSYLWV